LDREVAFVCEAYGSAVKAIITRRGEERLAGYETLERASARWTPMTSRRR
jgi:hypothetical protein